MERTVLRAGLAVLSAAILTVLLGCPPAGQGPYTPPVSGTPVVYAGGFSENKGVSVPGYWQDGTWVGLSPLYATQNAQVNSIYVSAGTVYSGGWAMDSGSHQVPGYWAGDTWTPLSQTNTSASSSVNALVVSGGYVYAGGSNADANGNPSGGYWANGKWTSVTPPSGDSQCVVTSIEVSGGTVYSGGYCLGGKSFVPVYWTGQTPTPLSELSSNAASEVLAIVVSGGQVYPAGYSNDAVNGDVAGDWPSGKWASLLPSKATVGEVYGIAASGGSLYASGWSNPTGSNIPGTWVNGTWSALSLPTNGAGTSTSALSIFVHGSDVYVGGYSEDTKAVLEIPGYWLNGAWVSLPTLSSDSTLGFYSQVSSIFVSP